MPRRLDKSNSQFNRAITKLPLGVSSNFRYWGDDKTIYIKKGKGGRLWDLDDNQYIDYRLAYGPIILGYQDERVIGLDTGCVWGNSMTLLRWEDGARFEKACPVHAR